MKVVRSPYTDGLGHHPLFRLDARRVTWVSSPRQLWSHSLRIVAGIHAVSFLVWGLLTLLLVSNSPSIDPDKMLIASINSLYILGLLTILADAILDFICLQTALKTIYGEVIAGRWDLLRLTALNEWGIVRAKYAGARLRVWRATIVVAGMRLATLMIGILILMVLLYVLFGENSFIESLIDGFRNDPLSALLGVVTTSLIALVYAVEPFWRMQAMTALGMVLSAQFHSAAMGMLAAVGVMVAVWLLQIVIVIALVLGLGMGLGVLLAPLLVGEDSFLASTIYLLLACGITTLTIYGFYALLQTWSLRRVVRRIDKAN
ncbi:MAG: hypothetical protein K8J31_19270 [Anaerolineae bacterium]|nr:hypothetical protein [Anaerolineae bacterium]